MFFGVQSQKFVPKIHKNWVGKVHTLEITSAHDGPNPNRRMARGTGEVPGMRRENTHRLP